MTHDEFIAEYKTTAERALMLADKARREGLLALEELLNAEKASERDILEYGLRFVVDGCDSGFINEVLSNILEQEKDFYANLLKRIKKEAVCQIQEGMNALCLAFLLNSFTDLSVKDDPLLVQLGYF